MPRRPTKRAVRVPDFLTYDEPAPPAAEAHGKKKAKLTKGQAARRALIQDRVKSKAPTPLSRQVLEAVWYLASPVGVSWRAINSYLDDVVDSKAPKHSRRVALRRLLEASLLRPHALYHTRFVRSTPGAAAKAAKGKKKKTVTKVVVSKKGKAAAAATTPKKKRKGMSAEALQVTRADSTAGVSGGKVYKNYSCSLKLINLAENMDKWYILQCIQTPADGKVHCFTRWGRTGTVGQSKTESFATAAEATAAFEAKYFEKTGRKWRSKAAPVPGKYKLIVSNDEPLSDSVIWQYWVDDHVDGKSTGWYNYADPASRTVEEIYQENTRNLDMEVRCVQSGNFSYKVDFKTMTQTNLVHAAHKVRRIRRGSR
mmetsp:Transcript_31471/g.91523  ORF Transcript_31471/g.91523 Transcript_31471/m.91523 type:complete len:369 (-) Transcript_31471:296-1402(-)